MGLLEARTKDGGEGASGGPGGLDQKAGQDTSGDIAPFAQLVAGQGQCRWCHDGGRGGAARGLRGSGRGRAHFFRADRVLHAPQIAGRHISCARVQAPCPGCARQMAREERAPAALDAGRGGPEAGLQSRPQAIDQNACQIERNFLGIECFRKPALSGERRLTC